MVFSRSFVRPAGPHVSFLRRTGVHTVTALLMVAGTVGLTAFVTNPAGASGTARYVAQGGSDGSNDCTAPTTPCATISHAVSQSNSGDTINVSGTIDDHVTIGTSLTVTQWSGQPKAVVDGTNSGTPFTINSGTVTLQLLTIENGTDSGGAGGGILNNGSLTLTNDTVMGNASSVFGGGIFNAGALTVNSSTLSGNGAAYGGGITNEGTVTVNSSTLSGNTATGDSGGIQNIGTLTVNRSTLSGNTAPYGGGILDQGTSLTVNSSTLSGNTATSSGGGVWSQVSGTSFDATIVAANNGGNCDGYANPTSLGYNLTDDSTGTACGFTQPTDLVNANPNLGGLANNGGPTQTRLPQPPSAAIEAIPNPTTLSGGLQVCPRTDQRGVSSSPGSNCTIGAVEVPSLRYVAQGGSDTSNDCSSPTTPCATISHAVSVIGSTSGDTVNVSGTIDDHVTIGTSLTVTQWFNKSAAVVDGTANGVPFTVNSGTTVTLNKLTIQNGSGQFGGGIFNGFGANLTVSNSTLSNNHAETGQNASGGGIYNNNDANLTVNTSTIENNLASVGGGGIFNSTGANLTVSGSTISGDGTDAGNGGGIYNNSGHATVKGSTFTNNATLGNGGGIYNAFSSTLTLSNSTLTKNAAGSGAAVYNFSSTLTVLASTLSGNGQGGGVDVHSGTVNVGATIVAANTGGNCVETAPTSLGYNLTDDTTGTACGFTATGDVVNANPNLGSLANNGGPTQTMLPPNPSPEAFVIPNPTTLGGTQVCPRTDQRGVVSPSGAACTIGAVEAIAGQAPALPRSPSNTWITGQFSTVTVFSTGTPTPTVTHPSGQPGDGTVPNGLTLSFADGGATLSGTPAANAGGVYSIKLIASNGVSPPATTTLTATVQQAPVMSLPPNGGTVGFKAGVASSVPWSVSAPATTWPHITQPVSYTTSGFPSGLNFNNNGNGTGTLSGTLAKGTYGPMSIKAQNMAGSSTTTFTIKAS